MAKGVFLNVCGGGHVIATYGMVAELVRRGDEIVYFETERYRTEIEALGATFQAYPDVPGPYSGPMAGWRFHHELDLPTAMCWWTLAWYPELLERVTAERPDYIVHDSLCLWGKMIAAKLGIPAITSVHTPALSWRLQLSCWTFWRDLPRMVMRGTGTYFGFRRLARELERRHGTRVSAIETYTNPQPVNICHTPRELQPHDHLFDASYHFVGSVHHRPSQEVPGFDMSRLDDDIIYIGFGTICDPGPEFFRKCLTAFADLDLQVVMLLSASTTPEDLGEVPPNFIVWSIDRDGLLPQLDILPRAKLFVMNGGMGGAREGSWFGIPMLAVPTTFETDIISIRLERQGAGLRRSVDSSPAELRDAARRLLSEPGFARHSARIGDACRRAGGAARAADLIQDHVARARAAHHPVQASLPGRMASSHP
ncbi:nucleotide disphospho-sugar-binding domain-containing protein [Bradyrhizobium sp. HKCCYLS2038]|uniref:nucleotide disphospho-sugar-binding domain-containing protein n=1 Tax=unclassified Bradyrhizobium TaxID=2631580 RepID=UPI003EBCED4C